MYLINAILETIGVCGGYYLILYLINKNSELEIDAKGYLLQEKKVYFVGIFTAISTFYISYVRLPGAGLQLHIFSLILICAMAVLTVTDMLNHWVPNLMILALLGIWAVLVGVFCVVNISMAIPVLGSSIVGGIVAGAIFLLCYIISKRQMGAGDVKLAFVMGLYLTGSRIMGAILYGTIICCVYSIVQLCRKKLGMKDGVPMVPFLYIGTIITFIIL